MNKEEQNPFLRESKLGHNFEAIELQQILIQGRGVMNDAEEISNQMDARIRQNIQLPFRLKGLLGITLGGMAGIWGVRAAWQAFHRGNYEQAAEVKNGSISKSALTNHINFLPKPASLVMDQIPTNDSSFLDTTHLEDHRILGKLLPKKLMDDIYYASKNERYYKKYIEPVFKAAVFNATENSQNVLLDKKLFISEAVKSFKYLSTFIVKGTMLNSPGLCDLKQCSLNIYRLLKKEFDDPSLYYKSFSTHQVEGSLSKEAIDASKLINIDSLCNELNHAINFLIKGRSILTFSSAAEIILNYARLASSEISSLNQSNLLQKLIFKNILNKLGHLNESFYRKAGAQDSERKFTFDLIQNFFTSGYWHSSSDTKQYILLLIVHATIIPDLIRLGKHSVDNLTDLWILNRLILDIKKERARNADDFATNSSITIPNVSKQPLIKPVKQKLPNVTQALSTFKLPNITQAPSTFKLPNITQAPSTFKLPNITQAPSTFKLPNITQAPSVTQDSKQKTTFVKKSGYGVTLESSTTTIPAIQSEGKGVESDIIKAAIAAVGVKVIALTSGVLPQIEVLRRMIANVPVHNIPASPNLPMEDLNIQGPSRSRSNFRFPKISDELNSRIAYTEEKLRKFVKCDYLDKSRAETHWNKYFHCKLDSYSSTFGEDYFIAQGLTLNSVRDQFNIRSAKMMVAEHLDFVNAVITKTLKLFDIVFNQDIENQKLAGIIMSYLVDYFKKTLNIEDDSTITEVLFRLREVALRSNKYLHTLASKRFNNIWFISTYGDIARNTRTGDFFPNMDSSRIRSLPMFKTIYGGQVDNSIIAMFPEAAHAINPEHPVPDFRYDSHHVGESLLHEITHASSATEDYIYFQATRNGRAKNAKEMMDEFYKDLKNNDISEVLRDVINKYCKIYNVPIPNDLYAFFEENPRLKAYIIMNNAKCYETFFRDISEIFPYDVDAIDFLRHSKVSDRNSLGQMEVLNEIQSSIGSKSPVRR